MVYSSCATSTFRTAKTNFAKACLRTLYLACHYVLNLLAHTQSKQCGIHSLNSWCSINFVWFEVMQESRLMFLFRTNTSPLGATCVTSGGSLQSALYLGNVISVCWQGVPTACCCRLMTHLGWAYSSLLFHACQYDTMYCNAACRLTQ